MLKLACGLGAVLTLAGICALPALADGADAQKTEASMRPARPAFSDIDTNKDGVISQAEFDAFHPKKADRDHDGLPQPGGHWRGHWRGRWHHNHRGEHGRMPFRGLALKRLDADKDGKVSFEEFIAPMKAHFSRMDTNKDGFLDESELKARPAFSKGGPAGDGPPLPPQK